MRGPYAPAAWKESGVSLCLAGISPAGGPSSSTLFARRRRTVHSPGASSSSFDVPIGRDDEWNVAQRFLGSIADGGPAGLIIEGEAGIGKTTLWRQALAAAEAMSYRVLGCRPAESETKLSFAALGDLMEPVADDVL